MKYSALEETLNDLVNPDGHQGVEQVKREATDTNLSTMRGKEPKFLCGKLRGTGLAQWSLPLLMAWAFKLNFLTMVLETHFLELPKMKGGELI